MNMITTAITKKEAVELFKKISSSFVGLSIETLPKLEGGKANPHQGLIRKASTFTAIVGSAHEYAKKVIKEASKEYTEKFGKDAYFHEFQAEKLWKGAGEKVAGAVVRHRGTGEEYLFYYPAPNSTPKVEYSLNGNPIEKSEIQGLPPSREGKSVDIINEKGEVEMSTTLNVFPTTLKFSSLKAFRLNGENYVIID